jgi:hypothetical protein
LKARKLARETQQQQASRLSREKMPPKVSAPVFVWSRSDTDPSQWKREPVTKSMREETLGEYSDRQRRYDSVFNEWDCWGEGDADDDEDDWGPTDAEAIRANEDFAPAPRSAQRSPSPPAVVDALPMDPMADVSEVVHVLSSRYGFLAPIPVPNRVEQVRPKDVEVFMRLLGLGGKDDSIFSTGLGKVVYDFVEALSSNRDPRPSLWDLKRECRQPLELTSRIKHIRHLPSDLFYFDFGRSSAVPWKIAVSGAADALYVCRMDPTYNEEDIALHLVYRGIPFRTLLPVRQVPRSPSDVRALPIRLPGYKFTKRDFDAYLHLRAEILTGPRGRAALLRGGILWRLAVGHTSIHDALHGPNTWTLSRRGGFSVGDPDSGEIFGDDDLSPLDEQLLCGAFLLYTGKLLLFVFRFNFGILITRWSGYGNQTATVSYFPLPSTYDASGENYGIWTERAEDEHQKWEAAVQNGAQPRPQGQWRDFLRGHKKARRLKASTSTSSLHFLNVARAGG